MSTDPQFQFDHGDEVKDRVSKFTGIVTVRAEWFNGCRRYGISSTKLPKEGKVADVENFDENQLELVKAAKIPPLRPAAMTGGPQSGERRVMHRGRTP